MSEDRLHTAAKHARTAAEPLDASRRGRAGRPGFWHAVAEFLLSLPPGIGVRIGG